MLKERLMKLEAVEDKYRAQQNLVQKTKIKSNEATLEETNMRRQLEDIKTVLEEEVRERKMIEKELKVTKKSLKVYETTGMIILLLRSLLRSYTCIINYSRKN